MHDHLRYSLRSITTINIWVNGLGKVLTLADRNELTYDL